MNVRLLSFFMTEPLSMVSLKIAVIMKKKHRKATNLDAVKAMRRGGREAERELFGPGFHSFNHIHKSKKTYTRKDKHKNMEE